MPEEYKAYKCGQCKGLMETIPNNFSYIFLTKVELVKTMPNAPNILLNRTDVVFCGLRCLTTFFHENLK